MEQKIARYLNATQITVVSLISLVLGHLMVTTYFPNELLNLVGLIATSSFIYMTTLRKKDIFSFVMVIYFCSSFPYMPTKGGGYNMVAFLTILLYIFSAHKFPREIRIKDKVFYSLVIVLVFSSILGWYVNYTGKGLDVLYSIITFSGIIFMLIITSSIELNIVKLNIFFKINFVLIIYSTIASLNKYLHIITFDTPMMPIYGMEGPRFEGGGVLGSSPIYGEHSLVLLILFLTIYLLNRGTIKIEKTVLILAIFIAYINVFMSISRSVFLLSVLGLFLLIFLQFKLNKISFKKILGQGLTVLFTIVAIVGLVKLAKLDYVFERVNEIEESNAQKGGITPQSILSGSAFGREYAFLIAKERYNSKKSWLIGYGWGLPKNNRDAFFVDPKILRTSPHTQIFAILFLFGWIGFFAYWLLYFRAIFRSYKMISRSTVNYYHILLSYFFSIALLLFVLNEIKVDSLYSPSYFTVTIMWLGFAYANLNYRNASKRTIPLMNDINN